MDDRLQASVFLNSFASPLSSQEVSFFSLVHSFLSHFLGYLLFLLVVAHFHEWFF